MQQHDGYDRSKVFTLPRACNFYEAPQLGKAPYTPDAGFMYWTHLEGYSIQVAMNAALAPVC
jgi:hypothetical protein